MMNINDIGEVCLENVFIHLSPYSDLYNCRLVCKLWNQVSKGECLMLLNYTLSPNLSIHTESKKRMSREFQYSISRQSLQCRDVIANDEKHNITPRYGHASVIFQGFMYVFGGYTAQKTLFNDIWRLCLTTRTWSRLISGGAFPPPKSHAVMIVVNDRLLLHGGQTLSMRRQINFHQDFLLFDDIREFDIKTNGWTTRVTTNTGPKLSGHTGSLFLENGIVFFGGLTLTDPANNTIQPTNDVWHYNLEKNTWNMIRRRNSGVVPPPRFGHSMVKFDSTGMSFLILGGCGQNRVFLNDVWLLRMCNNEECMWTPIILRSSVESPVMTPVIHLNPVIKVAKNLLLVLNPKGRLQNGNRSLLLLNILDISNVKSMGFVRWKSSFTRSTSSIEDVGLYSLLLADNEVFMFGGLSLSLTSSVTNSLMVISCQKSVTWIMMLIKWLMAKITLTAVVLVFKRLNINAQN